MFFFSDSHLRKKERGQNIKTNLYLQLVAKNNSYNTSNECPFLKNIYIVKSQQRGFFSHSTPKYNTSQKKRGIFHKTLPYIYIFFFFFKAQPVQKQNCIYPHPMMLFRFELALPGLYSLTGGHGRGWGESLLLCSHSFSTVFH